MKDRELAKRLDRVNDYAKIAAESGKINENTVKTAIFMYFGDVYPYRKERHTLGMNGFEVIAWVCLVFSFILATAGTLLIFSGYPGTGTYCFLLFAALSVGGCISYSQR